MNISFKLLGAVILISNLAPWDSSHAQAQGYRIKKLDHFHLPGAVSTRPVVSLIAQGNTLILPGYGVMSATEFKTNAILRESRDGGQTWSTRFLARNFFPVGVDPRSDGSWLLIGTTARGPQAEQRVQLRQVYPNGRFRILQRFNGFPGGSVAAEAIYKDSRNQLYVSVVATDGPVDHPNTQAHWMVLGSRDGISPLRILDHLPGGSAVNESVLPTKLIMNDRGQLLTSGWWAEKGDTQPALITRRSDKSIRNWKKVDRYLPDSASSFALGRDMFSSDKGRTLWAVGASQTEGRKCLIRRSNDSGSNWLIVREFKLPDGSSCDLWAGHGKGQLIVVGGFKVVKSGPEPITQGLILVSQDGGRTWGSPIIDPGPSGPGFFMYTQVRILESGRIIVSGRYLDSRPGNTWIVNELVRSAN